MAVRSRLRAILVPLFFYAVLGGASAYLVKNASKGQHGEVARAAFDKELAAQKAELAAREDERARWRKRVDSLRNESIDRDLLEEEAHSKLDRVSPEEVVIFTEPKTR